ncbi:phage tail tape measure protein [Enterococcus casseliflavus]|uniref:phage tail tape measure protein n=1 Tax=Enterococcus casseliflavus TaxID=37734 RepID=UPI0009BD946D|nr:phage tail tape measure protein [Enterococcus casseliflavus]OQO87176.1 phage tail tape measure protein [Enterococcus casseliflavus]
MEQFSVEAYLKATDSNFGSTFSAAMDQVKEFQDNTKSTMSTVGGIMTSAGKTMTKAVTLPILGLTTAAVKVGGDFEEQMSRVKAISGATGDAFEELRDQAIDLGAKTAFSAKESADGMENLASAGFDAQEIMAAMPGLLDLAAVSGGDVALASENAATALRGFGLEADQSGHIADVFARAAADTNAEVADMGEAMKYIAPVANAMGLSIEETAAAIGIMSDAGVKGSQAGTTLRGALSRIAKPTKAMRETMDELGVSFYDSEGNMISLQDQISLLSDSFDGLTQEQKNQALVTLYGQESLSGMMALIDKGPDSLGALTESLEQSDGAADEMARTMQDNMNSSIEQMLGAFESAAIVIQDILSPAIASIADSIGSLVEQFVSAPRWVQTTIVSLGLLAAAVGPILFGVGKLMKLFQTMKVGILALRAGFTALNTAVTVVGGGVKALFAVLAANPIILIIGAIVAAVAAFIYFWNTSEEFRDFFIGMWEGIKEAVGVAIEWIAESWSSMVEGAKNAVESVKKAWSDTKQWFADLWQGIKDSATGMWEGTKQAFSNGVDNIVSVWDGITQWFTDLWNGIKSTVTSIVKGIADGIMSRFGTLVYGVRNAFIHMSFFLKTLWTNLVKIAGQIFEIMKNVILAPVLFVTSLISGGWEEAKNNMIGVWNNIQTAAINIWTSIKAIFDSFLTNTQMAFLNIWNGIKAALAYIWTTIQTIAIDTFNSIVAFFVETWNNIKQGTIDAWNALKTWLSETWESMKQGATDTWNSVKQFFVDLWESIKTNTINMWNAIKDGVATAWENTKTAVINTAKGIVDGAKQAWEDLKQGVSNAIEKVKETFDQIRQIDLLQIGKDIIDGLVKGIKGKIEDVKNAVKDIAGSITGKIKDILNIHSPSRVMAELGMFTSQGLAEGMLDGARYVDRASSQIADRASNMDIGNRISAVNSQIQTQVQHEVSYGTNSKPALFNIQLGNQVFQAFVEDINEAQGNGINVNMQF